MTVELGGDPTPAGKATKAVIFRCGDCGVKNYILKPKSSGAANIQARNNGWNDSRKFWLCRDCNRKRNMAEAKMKEEKGAQ